MNHIILFVPFQGFYIDYLPNVLLNICMEYLDFKTTYKTITLNKNPLITNVSSFYQNVKYGHQRIYHKNNLKKEWNEFNNIIEGPIFSYYDKGKIQSIDYKDIGEYLEHDKEGNIILKIKYDKSTLKGTIVEYHSNGTVKNIISRKNTTQEECIKLKYEK